MHFTLFLSLILLAVASLCGAEALQLAKFQGSLAEGIELSTLISGGSTLSVFLNEESFLGNISNDVVLDEVSAGFHCAEIPGFQKKIREALLSGYVSVSGARRQLKLRLGPIANVSLSRDAPFTFVIPKDILSGSSDTIPMRSTIFVGISASAEVITRRPIVGSEVSIRIRGASAGAVRIVQGATCRGDAAKILMRRAENDTLSFIPLRGGSLVFCVEEGYREFQIQGHVVIAGAEGFSTNPSQPRSSKQFFTNLFGTEMNEQDSISLSIEGCTRPDSPDFELFELEYYSPSRAGFFAVVPVPGDYHVCYLRYGGHVFVDLGIISVERGGDSVIDGDMRLLRIEHDTLVASNAKIETLIISGGSLLLDRFHLNVSRLEWTGGAIYGPGTITVTGESSLIRSSDQLHIDFSLRNAGRLKLNTMGITLSSMGAIANYHKLIVELQQYATGEGFSIEGQLSHNVIRNTASGTIIFHGGDSGRIRIDTPVTNFGVVVLHDGFLTCSSYSGHRGSLLDIRVGAQVSIIRGAIQGTVALSAGSLCSLAPTVRHSIELIGALFRLADSSLLEFSSGSVTLSATRFDGVGTISFGSDLDLGLQIDGTNIFSFGTAVGFRNTKLVSPTGCALIFYGNVAVNLENTIIGDNVVIQSRLAAIMFAKGQGATRLVPIKSPQNASLVVPANATLVIVDTGGRSKENLSSIPVICSYYVVIPMYVAAEGDILLKGCAMLPFGGALNGMVFGVGREALEASIKTAFCRTALFGGEGCVAASALASSLSSGLVLSGQFRSDPKETSSFQLDYLKLLNGSLGVGKQIALFTPLIEIEPDSSLLLEGGGIISADRLVVRGLLQTQSALSIRGNLDARGGILRVPHSSGCFFPVTVDGEAQYDRAVVQCTTPPISPMTGALIKSESFVSEPSVDQASCSSASMVARVVLDQQSGLVLEVSESAFQISAWLRTSLMAIFFLLLMAWAWVVGFSLTDFLSSPPMKIDLMWTEFSMFIPNIIVALGCGMEVVFLCAPAFLHSVPNTFIFGWFSKMASSVMEPRGSASSPPLSVLIALMVYLWLFAWVPLCRKQLGHFMDESMSAARRRAVRVLFQFHTTIVLLAPPIFIPTLSLLTESVACNTIYQNAQSCQPLHFPLWPLLLASILFIGLCLFSGANCGFPFGHPPYQRDLDIRFKRSYVVLRYGLLAFLVGIWKLTGADRILMVSSSFALVFALFCFSSRSRPSGYRNVNTLLSRSLLFPLWAHICALFSEFHSSQSAVCPDTDYAFVIMVAVGWLLLTVATVYSIGGTRVFESEDEEISAQLRMIAEASHRIEECRSDMYNATTDREREDFSHLLCVLKLRHLKELTYFRHKKESILLPYYLGDQAASTIIQGPLPGFDDGVEFEGVESDFQAPTYEPDAVVSPLSIDLMDSYVRGPILGKGSYGTVFMGRLSAAPYWVAVKEVRVSSSRKDALERVKREVEFLQSLSHPNIIQYYGCRNKGGMILVFMEYATGGNLTSFVRSIRHRRESTVGRYVHDILEGLAYLHSKGIIHRDVKGENVLIDSSGVAKLADFGCSKLLADIANTSEAGCGTLIGSPYWMAPEVILHEPYGTKADIWSLGCTVVEMLNGGQPAWKEKFDTAYAAIYFIGHETKDKWPSNIPEDVSESCRSFLARCFERDASKRADASELLDHPWLHENEPSNTHGFSSASVSMESNARSDSPTADASYEREMSPFS